jgi:tetratricopeptide (TPR) repeat protein
MQQPPSQGSPDIDERMKKWILAIAAIALCTAAAAQTTAEEYLARFERLVRTVGPDGVGVETLLDRWEEDFPDDQAVHVARFNYHFQKSQRTEMVAKGTQRRYLGNPPSLTLKDADGQDVNYFPEDFYDEEEFAEAMKVLDRQIALHPDELRFHFLKVSALAAYEKESPDMAAAELKSVIERQASARPVWTLDGNPADAEVFQQGVGEYCYEFFQIGTSDSYEYFREISERMNKLFPKNPVFLDNLGSYELVVKENYKQAAKYYKKALKLDPDDYAAQSNLQLIERKQAQEKKK